MPLVAKGPKPSARKRRRLVMILSALAVLALAAGLVLSALDENLVYFKAPSDIQAGEIEAGKQFRLGGLVAENSFTKAADGLTVEFIVTDMAHEVPVRFKGLLPDLFREGQGVITEGRLDAEGVFVATSVLAKHDENYMPPEVAEALQKAGQWEGASGGEGDAEGGTP
jgi:cytochrome c-type biogenesis protein CcmE